MNCDVKTGDGVMCGKCGSDYCGIDGQIRILEEQIGMHVFLAERGEISEQDTEDWDDILASMLAELVKRTQKADAAKIRDEAETWSGWPQVEHNMIRAADFIDPVKE